ncbi:hypothetical protein JCM6882_002000 [Rhodosporidiobolus microsporus]
MSTPLDLTPGHSLGPFHLGSMLFNVINHLRTYRSAYPNAKIAWDDESPSTGPLHITLSSPPLHFLFAPLTQRLSRIEVASTSSSSAGAWVSYRGRPLQGEGFEDVDTVKVVRRAFGPTFGSSKVEADPAAEQRGGREEMLSYPGVAFGVVAGPSGSTLSRIVLTPLPSPSDVPVDRAWLHPVLPAFPSAAAGDLRLAEIYLDSSNLPIRTLLHFYGSEEEAPLPFELRIGETTSEDILCELGGAIRTFWKEDDRMSIHTASVGAAPPSTAGGQADDPSLSPNPYFLSYPHLGLTLLLTSSPTSPSPTSPHSRALIPPHTLLKVILHSNLPGESNFGRTARALWAFCREGGQGEKLMGVEDGAGKVREVLNRGGKTQDAGGGRTPSPLGGSGSGSGSGFSSASGSSNGAGGGGGGKKKKPSGAAAAAARLKETEVENLLGLSTFEAAPAVASAAGGGSGGVGKGEEEEKPMILDRGADGGGGGGGETGAGAGGEGGGKRGGVGRGKTTEIYGFPGVALEVTQEGEVETVWLF